MKKFKFFLFYPSFSSDCAKKRIPRTENGFLRRQKTVRWSLFLTFCKKKSSRPANVVSTLLRKKILPFSGKSAFLPLFSGLVEEKCLYKSICMEKATVFPSAWNKRNPLSGRNLFPMNGKSPEGHENAAATFVATAFFDR